MPTLKMVAIILLVKIAIIRFVHSLGTGLALSRGS